jgi:hypothetical protein
VERLDRKLTRRAMHSIRFEKQTPCHHVQIEVKFLIFHDSKVERSHLTDKKEFYQLLSYTDDVDLNLKLEEWEFLYNFNRPQGSFNGKLLM